MRPLYGCVKPPLPAVQNSRSSSLLIAPKYPNVSGGALRRKRLTSLSEGCCCIGSHNMRGNGTARSGIAWLPNFTLKLVRPGFGPPAEPAAVSPA